MGMKVRRVAALALAAAVLAGAGLLRRESRGETAFSPARMPEQMLVIDAGHGGEDGGAVSVSGAVESHLNLAVALRLGAVLDLYGAPNVLLRTEDVSLHDPDCQTLRQKKVSDLHNRVAAIEATPNAVLLSIHQNTFQSAKYHGAQVFYGKNEDSLPLAQAAQDALRSALDPSNGRTPTAIPSSVYLMNHITCPAILVECGFLSNPAEDALLQTPAYQTKLAMTLAAAYFSAPSSTEEGETQHESQNRLLLHPVRE